MKTNKLSLLFILTLSVASLYLAGCAVVENGGTSKSRRASSLVQYLFPKDTNRQEKPTIPVLNLPLKVGVAFVPQPSNRKEERFYRSPAQDDITEEEKMALMKQISARFRTLPFVQSIELIPTSYLQPEGGFENVEQLKNLYGIDVIALISYDQMQFNERNELEIAYWTIIGAYFIHAERNETRTMMDTAVFDIASRKLLFRAPGVSVIKDSASAATVETQLRRVSSAGFQDASTNLVQNLQVQLEEFKKRIKETPEEVKVVHKPGYTGAGANGLADLGIAVALLGITLFGLCKVRSA